MLQAVEAEISADGQVSLLEPIHLAQRSRAVVTILAPIDETAPKRGSVPALLSFWYRGVTVPNLAEEA